MNCPPTLLCSFPHFFPFSSSSLCPVYSLPRITWPPPASVVSSSSLCTSLALTGLFLSSWPPRRLPAALGNSSASVIVPSSCHGSDSIIHIFLTIKDGFYRPWISGCWVLAVFNVSLVFSIHNRLKKTAGKRHFWGEWAGRSRAEVFLPARGSVRSLCGAEREGWI